MEATETNEKFKTSLLTCSICYKRYQSPKVLPCLHVFCHDCIDRHYVLSRQINSGNLHCPTCAAFVPLPAKTKGIDSLRNDYITHRIEELFSLLSIPIDIENNHNAISEDISNRSSVHSYVKIKDKTFFKHVRVKEELKLLLKELKEDHFNPESVELMRLYYLFVNAKSNWKKRLQSLQKVLIVDPNIPDVTVNASIGERNRQKQDIDDMYKPVIDWIISKQDSLHVKLAEYKAVSKVTKDLLQNATYDQLRQCCGTLTHLLQQSLQLSAAAVDINDKPDNYEKLTEKEDNKENSDSDPLSAFSEEMVKSLMKIVINNGTPDPCKVTCKLIGKVSGKGSGPGQFNSPASATFAPNGDIMVADRNNFRLQVFDSDITYKGQLFKSKIKPNRVRINPTNSTFYVDEEGSKTIKVFTSEGVQLTGRIGGAHWSNDMIFHAIDSNGNLVMSNPSNYTISVHQCDTGDTLSEFHFDHAEEAVSLQMPHFVALGKDDCIIISETSENRVQLYTHIGHYLFSVYDVMVPRGVCADQYGNIFVAEGDAHRVTMFNRYGKLVQYLLTERDGIKYPMALEINDDGRLLVTQYGLYMPHELLVFQLNYKLETML